MPFTKTWVGTTDVYSLDTNWLPISIRNATYRWTASGSGTNEFYLELTGGGDPGIVEPANVYAGGTALTAGSAGSLAASRWDYADNDTLGFSTVYIRLSDGADPDSKVRDYVTFTRVPAAGDDVRIPSGSGDIAGGDYSSVAIADFVVEDGYTGTIGSSTAPLIIDPDAFRFYGLGESYIDIHSANISPQIFKTGPAGAGFRSLYLTGSNINIVNVVGGTVGIASLSGQTSTVAEVRVVGSDANVWAGSGCSLTTWYQTAGEGEQRCASTTTTVYGGTLKTVEEGAITTMNVYGGTVLPESTGTITTLNAYGGETNFLGSGAARTVSTLNQQAGTTVLYDRTAVTLSAISTVTGPVRVDIARP